MMILATSLLAFAVLSSFVSAATISVAVNQGSFSPTTVFGAIDDLVVFTFNAGDNSVSEATARLNDPCNTEGGFDSGVEQTPGGIFPIRVSTTNSIYVFSSPHCAQGMVMIVNPGPNDSVAQYMMVAEASGGGAPAPPATSTTAAAPPATSATAAAPPATTPSGSSAPSTPTSTAARASITSTSLNSVTPTPSSLSTSAGTGTSAAAAPSSSSTSAGDITSANLSGSMIIVAGVMGALLSFF